jgi:hypothetical protein
MGIGTWLIRAALSAGLIVTGIVLLILTLLLAASWAGFGAIAIESIEIENAGDEVVFVTPVGEREGGGVSLLPLRSRNPMLHAAAKRGDYEVLPGGHIELLYDADDVDFSDLVIRYADDRIVQIPAGRAARSGPGHTIRIDGGVRGSPLNPDVRRLLAGGVYAWRTWAVYAVETGLIILFMGLTRVRRRFWSRS